MCLAVHVPRLHIHQGAEGGIGGHCTVEYMQYKMHQVLYYRKVQHAPLHLEYELYSFYALCLLFVAAVYSALCSILLVYYTCVFCDVYCKMYFTVLVYYVTSAACIVTKQLMEIVGS